MKTNDIRSKKRRISLYTADQLLRGFEPKDAMSYLNTRYFKIFQKFVADGGAAPHSPAIRRAQAEHDAEISDALRRFLLKHTRVVGIMGGHGIPRSDRHTLPSRG